MRRRSRSAPAPHFVCARCAPPPRTRDYPFLGAYRRPSPDRKKSSRDGRIHPQAHRRLDPGPPGCVVHHVRAGRQLRRPPAGPARQLRRQPRSAHRRACRGPRPERPRSPALLPLARRRRRLPHPVRRYVQPRSHDLERRRPRHSSDRDRIDPPARHSVVRAGHRPGHRGRRRLRSPSVQRVRLRDHPAELLPLLAPVVPRRRAPEGVPGTGLQQLPGVHDRHPGLAHRRAGRGHGRRLAGHDRGRRPSTAHRRGFRGPRDRRAAGVLQPDRLVPQPGPRPGRPPAADRRHRRDHDRAHRGSAESPGARRRGPQRCDRLRLLLRPAGPVRHLDLRDDHHPGRRRGGRRAHLGLRPRCSGPRHGRAYRRSRGLPLRRARRAGPLHAVVAAVREQPAHQRPADRHSGRRHPGIQR